MKGYTSFGYFLIMLSLLILLIQTCVSAVENDGKNGNQKRKDGKHHYTDFEIYDLIDTMQKYTKHKTFYSLLSVTPDSIPKEISASFRKKSMEWHPDKSKDPNATVIYAVISSATKILQDQVEGGAKERYDWLLNEAPAWHRSAYYVKKFVTAKLSLKDVFLLIFVFINITQFVGMWCKFLVDKIIVWDAKRTLKEMGDKEFKKMVKRVETKEVPVEKFENDDYYHAYALTVRPIHKPHLRELLGFSIIYGIFDALKWVICRCCFGRNKTPEQKEE